MTTEMTEGRIYRLYQG